MNTLTIPLATIGSQLHRLLLASGTALVALLVGASVWQQANSLSAIGDLRDQADRLQHLDGMLIRLMDVDNAARHYLLSGSRDQFGPFAEHRASVESALEVIRRDLPPSPENEAALADLSWRVADKLRSLDQVVERGAPGRSGRDKSGRQADDIRDRLSDLKANVLADAQASVAKATDRLERARGVSVGLAAGAVALMVALFVVLERQLRLREQLARMLRRENRHLDGLVQERTAELTHLASHLTRASEAEKARLARELHDELGALLTAAKMEADWIASRVDESTLPSGSAHLARLRVYLERGIALKRRIIDDLRPPLLEDLGLVSTLRMLGEEFALAGDEKLDMRLPDADVELAPASALALYRIAQEALTNIRKHAHARAVTLALRAGDGRVVLEIADDGVGFRSGGTYAAQHGLSGMRHRVRMCDGDFTLASAPGAGTRIVVAMARPAGRPVPSAVGQAVAQCIGGEFGVAADA